MIIHTGKQEGTEGNKVWNDKGSLTVAGNATIKGNTQILGGFTADSIKIQKGTEEAQEVATIDQVKAVSDKTDKLDQSGIVAGKVTKSDAENSVAIGKGSVITGGAWDMEANKAIPSNGTAIGAGAEIQNSAVNGTALGQGAGVYQSNATAIGQGARVASNATNGAGSVALGQGSFVGYGDAKDIDTNGVVSVGQSGKNGFSRRLINVADGINDSDAATVGQLNASAGDVSKLEGSGIKHRVEGDLEEVDNLTDAVIQNHKDIDSTASKMDDFSRSGIMAGGTDASTRSAGGNSIQLGNQSRAEGQQSVAIGAYAKAYGEDTKADMTTRRKNNATALGYTAMAGNYDTVAVGTTAKAAGENASAFGSGAQALSAGSTAIGQGALADQSENATVFGQEAQAVKASNAVVLGQGAKALAGGAVVLGSSNTANGQASTLIGIGNESHANATNSIAIGGANKVLGAYSMAFGYQAGAGANPVGDQKAASNAMAFGTGTQAFADDSIAMGTDASISGAQAAGSVVIGKNSYSAAANSVALGADSQVWKEDVLDSDSMGVISVGDSDKKNGTRRIINVKDGINDTDAATYGQVKGVANALTDLSNQAVTYTDKDKTAVNFNSASLNNVGDVNFQMKGGSRGLIASGITPGTVYAKADGWTDGAAADTGSLAIGGGMQGSDSSAATVRGKNSVAIGAGSEVDVQNAQVEPGWNAFENANGTAVGVGASVTGVQGTAVGSGSAARANQTVAVGEQAKANAQHGTAIGQNTGVDALKGTAIGQGASVGAGADNSIALGTGSVVFSSDIKESDKNGVLSVGKSGEERRIIHVADGIEDTDAATYGQLKKVSDQVTGLNDLAVTYTDKTKTAVNFNQAALNNVGDVNFQMKGESRGLIASGIAPGKVYTGISGWTVNGAADTGSLAIGGGMQGSESSAASVRGKNSVAIGAGAEVDVQNAKVDPGWNAFDSANGTAVGVGASVTGVQGTAIGSGSAAKANQTVAVGEQAKANAQYGTAIGQNAGVEALKGTALGQGASVGAGADNSIALGYGSTVFSSDIKDSDKNGVLSIGKGGEERRIIHVADGVEDTDAATVGQIKTITGVDTTKGSAIQYDDKDQTSVTFGSTGTAVTLKNVSDIELKVKGGSRGLIASGITPGTVYAASDGWKEDGAAVTGSLAIGGGIPDSMTSAASVRGKNSLAIGSGAKIDISNSKDFENANSVALGIGANVSGAQSVAVGKGAKAAAKYTTAVGEQAQASGESAAAFGQNAIAGSAGSLALGKGANVGASADNSISLGTGSVVFSSDIKDSDKNGVLSIGSGNAERRIIHVAAGINDTDAVTVGQIKDWKGVDVTKGQAVQYDKDGNLNVNKENSSLKVNSEESSISHGKNHVTADKDGVTISSGNNGIQVSGDKGTIITGTTDINGDLNVSGSLSIGGKTLVTQDKIDDMSKDLGSMKFENKAATDMTDAVNKNYAATQQNAKEISAAKEHIGVDDKGNFAAISNGASTLTEGINQNTSAIEQNQRDIQSLGGSVNKLGHEVDSVGALSAALAGLHPIDDGGLSKFQLSAAMGTYDGTQALALGGFYNVSPDVRLSMGLSTNLNGGDRKMAGNVGATFLIGSGVSKSIKSTAAVDQKVEELQAANEAQQKEIDELKAQLQKLLAK